jgi:hypothetical protein
LKIELKGGDKMSDYEIIAAARHAEDTGDFSEIEKISEEFLQSARRRWSPHTVQDQKHKEYCVKPWWKRVFLREPGSLPDRFQAADNLYFATALQGAVASRNVRAFTGRP